MKYGVIEAVHEFCVVNNYEIVYMTLEWSGHNSFALSRINEIEKTQFFRSN